MIMPQADTEKNNGEIPLRSLFLELGSWLRYLLGHWVWISFGLLIGAGLLALYANSRKPKYEADLIFVLEESNHSSMLSAYSGLASQFGIDLGSGSNSGIFNQDNIVEFFKSKLMVEHALLTGISWEGRKVSMADAYIDVYNFRKAWAAHSQELSRVTFPPDIPPDKLDRLQDSVMNLFYLGITKNLLTVEKPDKHLNFIAARVVSLNEEFSKTFVERLVDQAIRYYVTTKTMSSQSMVDKLQYQADSLLRELNSKTYNAAMTQDLNQNPATHLATVHTEFVNRDKMILETMYGEVIKNLEMAKISLAQETPIIQIVDVPRYPLKILKLKLPSALAIGGFLGVFCVVLVLVIRRVYKKIMAT